MEKLIITAAVCGAEATKEDNPNLPITPQEIAESSYYAVQAGAAIIHLHVRDQDGMPTQDKDVFGETIALIRERCSDVIIQPSTGGAVGMSFTERAQPLEIKPEMATLTTGTINFGNEVFYNPPECIEQFAMKMREMGIKPEIEVFDFGMIANTLRLVKEKLVTEPLHFNFVMGVRGGIPGTIKNLLHLAAEIPCSSTWTVSGMGRHQLPLSAVAITIGGNVRVGLEDNLYYRKGELAKSNAELVARVVRLAKELERPVANSCEARKILGL